MKRMIAAAVVAFAVCAEAYDGLFLPVYSYAKSDAELHIREFRDYGRQWDFPSYYTGHRSVCWLPGASSNMAFTAWVGGDVWQPGDPFGFTPAASPSNTQAIALTLTSAVTPRIKLKVFDESDRSVVFGDPPGDTGFTRPYLEPTRYHVRVIRYKCGDSSVGAGNYRTVLDKWIDCRDRDYLHEGDFTEGTFDIDWDYMAGEIGSKLNSLGSTVKKRVCYAVSMNSAYYPQSSTSSSIATNAITAHPIAVERYFDTTRTAPTAISCVTNTAAPMFVWRVDGDTVQEAVYGTTYTAYRIRVYDAGSSVLHDTGYRHMPPAGMDGAYRWTAPAAWTADIASWATWKVFTYNSRFKTDDVSSSASGFTTR